MRLQDILHDKGTVVHTIVAKATLDDAVQTLVKHNCGSLVVCEEGRGNRMIGIITERDILRACAAHRATFVRVTVAEVMTAEPITGSLDDAVADVMGLMTRHRIRHLPIIEAGELRGIVSIGDIVKAQHDQLTMENHFLKSYIQS